MSDAGNVVGGLVRQAGKKKKRKKKLMSEILAKNCKIETDAPK